MKLAGSMYCRKCGYCLHGLDSRRCPECGRAFDPARPSTYRRRPSSRLRRWALRALLAVLALASIPAGMIGYLWYGWRSEQRAIAELGGRHFIESRAVFPQRLCRLLGDHSFLADRVTVVQIEFDAKTGRPARWTPGELSFIGQFSHLEELSISGVNVHDDELAILPGLRRLKRLRMGYMPITDAALAQCAGLDRLESLYVPGARLDGSGLLQLGGLRRLRELVLDGTLVTDESLRVLPGFTNLQVLSLADTPISDAGIEHILKCRSLRRVCLDGTLVGDTGMLRLAQLPQLAELSMSATHDRLPRITQNAIAVFVAARPGVQFDAQPGTELEVSAITRPRNVIQWGQERFIGLNGNSGQSGRSVYLLRFGPDRTTDDRANASEPELLDVWTWEGQELRRHTVHGPPEIVGWLDSRRAVVTREGHSLRLAGDAGPQREWPLEGDPMMVSYGSQGGQFLALLGRSSERGAEPGDLDRRCSTSVALLGGTSPDLKWIAAFEGDYAAARPDDEGKRVAVSGDDRVCMVSVPDGRILWQANAGDGADDLAFSRDGQFIYAACGDRLLVLSAATGQAVRQWSPPGTQKGGGPISLLAVSPDGRWLACAGRDWAYVGSYVHLIDLEKWMTVAVLDHFHRVRAMSFSPDSRSLATAGGGQIKIWDLPERKR